MRIKKRNLNRLIENYLFEEKYPYAKDEESANKFRAWVREERPDIASKYNISKTGDSSFSGLENAYEKSNAGKDFEQDQSYFGIGSYFSDYEHEDNTIKNYNDVRRFLISNGNIDKNDAILMINGHTQRFELYKGGSIILKGKTSTGAGGFANKAGGSKTSTGLMQISSIAGKGEELYTVLVALRPTSPRIILDKHKKSPRGKVIPGHDAEVTTRALVLSGLELENANVKDRNIYVHGTNREDFLGTSVSGGCIRVSNENIVKLADDHMSSGDYVYIYYSKFKSNTIALKKGSKGSAADVLISNTKGTGRSLYTIGKDIVNETEHEALEVLYHDEASEEEMLSVFKKYGKEPNA